jgi:hypothetical protein
MGSVPTESWRCTDCSHEHHVDVVNKSGMTCPDCSALTKNLSKCDTCGTWTDDEGIICSGCEEHKLGKF